jgi:TRAP-type C4-dicarboxylate transport system substrate-binding protein
MRYSFSTLAGSLATALAAMSFAAVAQPVKLTFSYYTSDREVIYLSAVKPFIDSVNAAANGLIEIDAFTSGSLGKSYAGQAQLVLDGGADFAFVNPGLTPEQFPDDGVMELPGLFRDVREASVVYTRLVATRGRQSPL